MMPLLSLSVQVSYREDGVCCTIFLAHPDIHMNTQKHMLIHTPTCTIHILHTHSCGPICTNTHRHNHIQYYSSSVRNKWRLKGSEVNARQCGTHRRISLCVAQFISVHALHSFLLSCFSWLSEPACVVSVYKSES